METGLATAAAALTLLRTEGTETVGTNAPPVGNTPNRSVVDVCGGGPCHAVP